MKKNIAADNRRSSSVVCIKNITNFTIGTEYIVYHTNDIDCLINDLDYFEYISDDSFITKEQYIRNQKLEELISNID